MMMPVATGPAPARYWNNKLLFFRLFVSYESSLARAWVLSVCDRSCVYICTVALCTTCTQHVDVESHTESFEENKPKRRKKNASNTTRPREYADRPRNLEQRNKTSLLFAIKWNKTETVMKRYCRFSAAIFVCLFYRCCSYSFRVCEIYETRVCLRAIALFSTGKFHTYLNMIAFILVYFFGSFVIRCAYSVVAVLFSFFSVSVVVALSCKRNDLIEFDSFICWTNSFVFVCAWLLFLFIAAEYSPLAVLHNKYPCAILLYEFSIHKSNLRMSAIKTTTTISAAAAAKAVAQCNYTLLVCNCISFF